MGELGEEVTMGIKETPLWLRLEAHVQDSRLTE